MVETTNNFCQKCISDYGKYENNCYHKTEKFENLYYDQSQTWKQCDSSQDNFICSICPKGTYIKNSSSQICEKCKIGEYSDSKDANNCKKCPKGYYSTTKGASNCQECPEGYTSIPGSNKCYLDCEPGYSLNEDKCTPCQPGFYEDQKSSLACKECEENKYSLFGFNKCLPCEQTIPNCRNCTKNGICLDCNNNAVSGYDNCTICENNIDWEFTENYCKLLLNCPNYFYKEKKNNNKINCIDNILECPEGMNYLNLETKECKENVSNRQLAEGYYQIKGGNEVLNNIP